MRIKRQQLLTAAQIARDARRHHAARAGGHAGSLRPDGTIEAEIQVITSATNEMGFGKLSAR